MHSSKRGFCGLFCSAKEVMLMLTIDDLLMVIAFVITVFGFGYMIGKDKNAKK